MKNINTLISFQNYFRRSLDLQINKGDVNKLYKVLEMHCVEKKDIIELIAILKSEKPDYENRQLGENANDWILKVFGKVINCVGKINTSLTANSLAVFVKQYYGIWN